MQIFELHFNTKLKEGKIFDSFVYEPENAYEKKLGSLYIVGELQNALPSNSKLLDDLAQVIKKNYYTLSIDSSEKALSYSSKKANEFLADQVKKENVSWLGNLNFAVVSSNNLNLSFTKTGELKILLLREGQIIDIGKNLDLQDIDPYPLKIFFNVVSGKLMQDDVILILTKQVFDFFKEQNLLIKIAQMKDLSSQNIKKILPADPKVSGICFMAVLTSKSQKEKFQPILFQANKAKSMFRKIPMPKLPKINFPKIPKLKLPKLNKKLILIIVLILILIFGFYIFKGTGEREEKKEAETSLEQDTLYLEIINKLEKIENPEIAEQEFSFPASSENITYFSNVYSLDKQNCEVIKSGKNWMKDKGPCSNPKSMAIDGSVWILNNDNSIIRYHAGQWQETITLNLFPDVKNITKILTKPNILYLYLLEPVNNRVIIIDKTGKTIKQFQSDKFNNLKDLAISSDGQTIYLLNDSIIYKLDLF